MLQATLCFIFNPEGHILLCMKKRGFGEGKWNGAGGKQLAGESIEQTTTREFLEETGVNINTNNLEKKGVLHFLRDNKPEWNQSVHVFLGKEYIGVPTETEEMLPKRWDIDTIPYGDMREDDIIWLPEFIAGKSFEYQFTFNQDNKIYHSKKIT